MTRPALRVTLLFALIAALLGQAYPARAAATLTDPSSNVTGWTYGTNSWLATQALPNGITAAFTYDAAGQLTRLTNATTSATLTDYGGSGGMTYDGAGNRLSVPVTVTGSSALTGTTNYSYSTLNQLTGESSTRNGGYSQTNVYDSAGNPTTLRSTSGLTYNSDNQSTADTFDGNGNPTTYNSTTLTLDSDNELTAYGTALTAAYGADGLRAWKNNGTATTYFLYDGAAPVCELNSSGTVTALNVFGPDGLISRTTSAGVTYYTFDANGSVAQRTNASGAAVSSDIYDGFGNGASAPPDPFGYGAQFGYYTDSETGLILCGQRYYDPSTARWLTRDPIGYSGGMDLYAYCGDGPVGNADPSGLDDRDPQWVMTQHSYWKDQTEAAKQDVLNWVPDNAVGTVMATTANSLIDVWHGVADTPYTYANLGTGLGTFAGDPSLENAPGAAMDVVTFAGTAMVGVGGGGAAEACENGCFIAGTPVAMADGTSKPIEQIKSGDKVESRDPATGKTEAKQVVSPVVKHEAELVTLSLSDSAHGTVREAIVTTPDHPFYVKGTGFVAAGKLGIGTQIVTRAGPSLFVIATARSKPAGGATVYNLVVATDHSFFVGAADGGAWVHNINCPPQVDLDQESVDHIVSNHWPTSGKDFKGQFSPGTRLSDLKSMIGDAIKNGSSRPNTQGRPGTISELNMGQPIGTASNGSAASDLRVVIQNGRVTTAFPY